jgi:hypothetical protein
MMCEREIDIIASEQEMIADSNSSDARKRCALPANLEKTEIGRTATDIDD